MHQPTQPHLRSRALPWILGGVLLAAFVAAIPLRRTRPGDVRQAVFERVHALPDTAALGPVAAELAGYGATAIGPLFELYEAKRSLPAGAKVLLSERQDEVVARALGTFPPSVLFGTLADIQRNHDGTVRAFLDLAAAHGQAQEIETIVERVQGRGRALGELQPRIERTLAAILRRDDGAWAELDYHWKAAPADLQPCFLRAVGLAGRPEGLELLVDAFGREARLEPLLLAQVAELAPRARIGSDPSSDPVHLTDVLLDDLERRPAGEVRYALVALGRLGRSRALLPLIRMLSRPEPELVKTAGRALREITGLDQELSASEWLTWHSHESAWFREHGASAYEELDALDVDRVLAALESLSEHRLHRSETAERLAPLLGHDSPDVRRGAERALATLGVSVDDVLGQSDANAKSVAGGPATLAPAQR